MTIGTLISGEGQIQVLGFRKRLSKFQRFSKVVTIKTSQTSRQKPKQIQFFFFCLNLLNSQPFLKPKVFLYIIYSEIPVTAAIQSRNKVTLVNLAGTSA